MKLFQVTYGREIIAQRLRSRGSCLIVSEKKIVDAVRPDQSLAGYDVRYPLNLNRPYLDDLIRDLSTYEVVVGLGGGTVLDAAKYIAWRLNTELILVPTATSSNAAFTFSSALRQSPVRPIGLIIPKEILIDYDLIASAPTEINRAGIGECLCAYSGLADWRLAEAKGFLPKVNPYILETFQPWKDRIPHVAGELGRLTPQGFQMFFEWQDAALKIFYTTGCTRLINGSEHFFVQCLETVTGTEKIHGEMVSLGVILMLYFHREPMDTAGAVIRSSRVRIHPEEIGYTWDAIFETLERLPSFAEEKKFPYSVANEIHLSQRDRELIRKTVEPYRTHAV